MNTVILVGRLVNGFELYKGNNDTTIIKGCLAVSRDFKNQNGEYESDFINFVVVGKSADYIFSKAHKGDLLSIVGSWRNSNYTNKNGEKVYKSEVSVKEISILVAKKLEMVSGDLPVFEVGKSSESETETETDDPLPF